MIIRLCASLSLSRRRHRRSRCRRRGPDYGFFVYSFASDSNRTRANVAIEWARALLKRPRQRRRRRPIIASARKMASAGSARARKPSRSLRLAHVISGACDTRSQFCCSLLLPFVRSLSLSLSAVALIDSSQANSLAGCAQVRASCLLLSERGEKGAAYVTIITPEIRSRALCFGFLRSGKLPKLKLKLRPKRTVRARNA